MKNCYFSDSKSEKQVTTLDLTLHRREGEDFGFHLAFSNSFIEEAAEGEHVVHWVQAGGCAEDAGLRDGDKIIAVSIFTLMRILVNLENDVHGDMMH